jgi:uncharacterized protein (DUF2164 family)
MTRQETNLEILSTLKEYFEKEENKDIRFFQGMSNLKLFTLQMDDEFVCIGINDPYYEESVATLDKIKSNNA